MADRDDTTTTSASPDGPGDGPPAGPHAGTGQGAAFGAVEAAALDAFAAAIAAGDLSLIADGEGGLDLTADAWTLHLDGWPGPREAWVAVDDEPEDPAPAVARDLLVGSLDAAILAALTAFDARLNGYVTAALRASADPLSVILADVLVG